MIRCDIHKGKLRLGNFIEPGRDAQPRKDEGFVIDHGHIGKLIKILFPKKKIHSTRVPISLCYTYKNKASFIGKFFVKIPNQKNLART